MKYYIIIFFYCKLFLKLSAGSPDEIVAQVYIVPSFSSLILLRGKILFLSCFWQTLKTFDENSSALELFRFGSDGYVPTQSETLEKNDQN